MTSQATPEIRANWTRMMVDGYRGALPPETFERAVARVDEAKRDTFDDASHFDWLDATIHLAYLEGPWGLMPSGEFRALWQRHVLGSFQQPIFRALITGAQRVFHGSPLSLARVIPSGWSLVSRTCGTFEIIKTGDSTGIVRVAGMPPSYRKSIAFATAWAGALDAFVTLSRLPGNVDVDVTKLASQGVFDLRVSWREAAEAYG